MQWKEVHKLGWPEVHYWYQVMRRPCVSILCATKILKSKWCMCACRCVHKSEREIEDRGGSCREIQYCTHVFPCASSDLAVYYKLVHIKIDVYVIKGTEISQVCYGKPMITSPRPYDNLSYCPHNSHWRHIWGSVWVPHLLLLTWLLCQFHRNLKCTE